MELLTCRLSRAIPPIAPLALFLFVASALCFGPAVSATSFVMMSDEALTDLSPAIIEGRVVSVDAAPTLDLPSTDYMIEVDRVLKGAVPGSTLIVRVPGGIRTDGVGFHVFGAPRFDLDDRALLFLSPANDGTFRLYQLMLGAFYERRVQGERFAVRNFAETRELEMPGREGTEEERLRARAPRLLDDFAGWIADRARGTEREPDYFLEPGQDSEQLRSQLDAFTLFVDPVDGLKMRWFLFDQGQTVFFRIHQDGQPGLSMQQFETAVRRGTNVWSTIPGTNIRYGFAGTTNATGGLRESPLGADGVNTVVAEDPNGNDRFGGAYNCFSGGVLAIGGPWFTIATQVGPGGEQFHRIVEGDIITNKNLGCFFDGSGNRQAAADELFTHELGHTLGYGHSCGDGESGPCNTALENEAIMRASVHDDGRGARINDDDRAASRALYPSNNVGGPIAPSGLTVTILSSSSIRLQWTDNSDDEDRFIIQQRVDGVGGFQTVAGFFGPNTTAVDLLGLTPGTTYSYRVRARNGSGSSAFSNIATVTLPLQPNAPNTLTAAPISATEIQLDWNDNSINEEGFAVQMRSRQSGAWETVETLPAGAEQAQLSDLDPGTPYTFRVRATNGNNPSEFSNEASATTKDPVPGPCVADDENLCLLDGRFRVQVEWRDGASGDTGVGHAIEVPGSDLTGLFWFFDEANIELVVKSLDATSFTDFFWNFYGALSSVEYWITVTDTEAGESVTYHNPQNEICGFPDTQAFPRPQPPEPLPGASDHRPRVGGGQSVTGTVRRLFEEKPELRSLEQPGSAGACVPSATALCLVDDRFRVEVDWDNSARIPGDTGVGRVRPVNTVDSDETGFFWFFDEENIELVVKVLDARILTDTFWVFYGALSDVEYRITVTDTQTGNMLFFDNPAGDFCGDADTTTFLDE